MIKDSQTPQNPETTANTNQLSWLSLSVHTYIKMGIVGVLFFMFFYNELYYSMLRRWLTESSWSHGFLIPLFSLYFLNQQKQEILSVKPKPNYLGLVVMLLTLAVYILNALQINFGILFAVLMLPMLIGIVLLLGGFQLIKYTWLPILYIGFAIPLPDRLYKAITIPMRIWASTVATGLLNLVKDLEATSRGVIIDIVYKGKVLEPSLDVAEACSGMRLLMAFVALGVAMAYLHKRHWTQRLVLLASTIPIAIFCNIVRVAVTGFIYVLISPKYAQGIYHDALGMAMLPLAFGMYGLLAWFMSNIFVDEKTSSPNEKEIIIAKNGSAETDNVAKNE
jgi:exosortase